MSIRPNIEPKENYIALVLLHIAIGVLMYVFEPISKLYFITAFVYFTYRILFLPSSKDPAAEKLAAGRSTQVQKTRQGAEEWTSV